MLKHEVIWYTSDDGKIFENEEECMNHETRILFKNSGIRLYDEDCKPIKDLVFDDFDPNCTYNKATYIIIDRTKNLENKALAEQLYDNYGWILFADAINGTSKSYKIHMSNVEPLT